jgi:hypothetical protein
VNPSPARTLNVKEKSSWLERGIKGVSININQNRSHKSPFIEQDSWIKEKNDRS